MSCWWSRSGTHSENKALQQQRKYDKGKAVAQCSSTGWLPSFFSLFDPHKQASTSAHFNPPGPSCTGEIRQERRSAPPHRRSMYLYRHRSGGLPSPPHRPYSYRPPSGPSVPSALSARTPASLALLEVLLHDGRLLLAGHHELEAVEVREARALGLGRQLLGPRRLLPALLHLLRLFVVTMEGVWSVS